MKDLAFLGQARVIALGAVAVLAAPCGSLGSDLTSSSYRLRGGAIVGGGGSDQVSLFPGTSIGLMGGTLGESGVLHVGTAPTSGTKLLSTGFWQVAGRALDTDSDGVLDDGDGSGTPGDSACFCQAPDTPDGCNEGCDDNCRFRANPDQIDSGGVASSVPPFTNGGPDSIGDACQCADMNSDGVVDSADLVLYRRKFAGQVSPFSTDLCSVVGGNGVCDSSDLVVMRRTFAGQSIGVLQNVCPAFLGLLDPGP